MNPVLDGFLSASAPEALVAMACGALIGLIAGMLPGVTISSGIIIVLPLTFVMGPHVAISLLLGIYSGGMTGGSFSAILLNIPGTPSASATGLDGHRMARRGEAGLALGASIFSSFFGGMFSLACLFLIAPQLAAVALKFRAQDLFSLVFFGLTIISSFAVRSVVKGLLSGLLGLMLVTVGQDPVMGTARYTFGSVHLLQGVHFLTALIGLFAIPQLAEGILEGLKRTGKAEALSRFGSIYPKLRHCREMALPSLIGSVVGTFIGILPGTGGPIAAFLSYDYSKKFSRHPERFGTGCIEGVAAPEAGNNAVCGGALIPMMTLGIPGDPVTAILIGALLVHGLAPGPMLFIERPDFAYTIMFSFFWSNVFTLAIALLGVRLLVKVLDAPKAVLIPAIAVLCTIGSFALRNSFFDIYVMLAFGLLGLLMQRLEMPVVPLILALVLGRPLEENLRVALTASQGDPSVFFTSPISLGFLILSAVTFVWPFVQERRARAARA
ncbi:MAG: tripartite tricarboxylate transporter permease [Candidatus Tectomicrobia bacterium]|uniref:Tripartite tricarboxylate transporter permease n=1 Tax=Tectimicrobiota bacterium TaxID=2528274 RepID=A0A932MMS8_UNCTE|nr:tripartite tricarboxylate transporter permease [Candidatus Tectomicrobia bacterium]